MGEYQREFTHEELLARARLIAVAKQERDAELDRLRAERDTWRNVAESHEPATSLRQAEFARMDLELGRLRAELASRQIDVDTFREGNRQLRAQLATLREQHSRVLAENELGWQAGAAKDARIAELENKNSYNLQIVREATASAGRAEAERDALHLFSGAQAAVIKEMREALELVLKYEYEWLVPSSLADVARAALAPSPAGPACKHDCPLPSCACASCCKCGEPFFIAWQRLRREERHEMTSIGDKEPDADPAGEPPHRYP